MCSKFRRRSIFCILPPHLLHAIAERGTPEQRLRASRTLALDTTMRALRLSPFVRETRSRFAVQTGPAAKDTIYSANNLQQLPGTVVASEASPPTPRADVAVREAFDGLGATWDLYFEVFIGCRLTTRGCHSTPPCITGIAMTMHSGMGPGWYSGTETVSCSTASPSRLT